MNLVDKILRGYTKAQFFKGTISNCKSETLTHTSGKISTNWELFRGNVSRGKIETEHTHYVDLIWRIRHFVVMANTRLEIAIKSRFMQCLAQMDTIK